VVSGWTSEETAYSMSHARNIIRQAKLAYHHHIIERIYCVYGNELEDVQQEGPSEQHPSGTAAAPSFSSPSPARQRLFLLVHSKKHQYPIWTTLAEYHHGFMDDDSPHPLERLPKPRTGIVLTNLLKETGGPRWLVSYKSSSADEVRGNLAPSSLLCVKTI
jgi:hypothetical protein